MKFSPFAAAAVAVCGVYAASAGIGAMIFVICAAAVFIMIYTLVSRKIDAVMITVLIVFAAAAGSYTIAVSDKLHALNSYDNRYAEVYGTVSEPGRENSYDDNIKYTVRISGIETDSGAVKIRDKIVLTSPEKLECGDEVILKGIIKKIPDQMNDDGADMRTYYKSLGIFRKIYTEDVTVTGGAPLWDVSILGGRIREWIDKLIYSAYSGDGAAVLSAVLTGNNHHFSEEYDAAVENTAIKRMLHPAYLYILITTFMVGLFSGAVNKRVRDIAVVLIMLLFALVGGGVGFTRCMLTGVMAFAIRRISGTKHYIDTISWLVLLYAVLSPLILFNSGFIMSVTAGIAVWAFMPILSRRLRFIRGWAGRAALIVVICTVFTMPVAALYFRGICIYAPLAAIVMTPAVAMIIVFAPAALIAEAVFGSAPVIGAYVDFLLWAVIRITYLVEALPFSQLSVPSPGTAAVLMFLSAELWLYYYMKKSVSKAAVFAAAAAGLFTASAVSALSLIGTAEFTFVNVGQGDGALIRSKFRENIIIDGGGKSSFSEYDPGSEIFVPYLMAKGVNTIDAAFVSHFHSDHVMGVIAAVRELNVENVFAPAPEDDWGSEMIELASELEKAAEENGAVLHYISEDTRIEFESGLVIEMYPPNEILKLSDDENNTSMLIRAEYNGVGVLYSGDLTSFGEYAHLLAGTEVDSDIMKVGHHGSKSSSRTEWVEAVSPQYTVISCGENNSYGHPAEETLERLAGTTVLRTDMRGDITFRVGRDGEIKIKSLR